MNTLSRGMNRLSATRRLLATSAATTAPPATTTAEYAHLSDTSRAYIDLERRHCAYNYHPLPVVLERGYQTRLWDVEGREYFDFLSAYSAVNQGHCHPHIVAALSSQAAKLTLTSRAFHSNALGAWQRRLCDTLGFARMLPANSGVEACEAAVKLARRWGHDVKRIPANSARVVVARGNFWGRSIAAVSSSCDPVSRNGFGPFVPGFVVVDYDDVAAVQREVEHPHTCAVMLEPVQGEAGVIIPSETFLRDVRKLCDEHNVLIIADEVQTGLGRTGKLLCVEHSGVVPDMVVLGKALGGGMYPVSAVLGGDDTIGLLQPGEHGSTFAGNPLACAVGQAALDVIENEGLCENAAAMGTLLRQGLNNAHKAPREIVKEIRGVGLMNAVVVHDVVGGERTAWQVCLEMARHGVLAKPTHGDTIRLAPPLVITQDEVEQACIIIRDALRTVCDRADDLKKELA